MDFFATLGGAGSLRSLFLAAEAGLGIHSTREVRFEQEDVFVYSARAEVRGFDVVPSVAVLGQMHGPSHAAIRGVEDAEALPDVLVFHAGTTIKDGQLQSSGGRVLAVTGMGKSIAEAAANSRQAADAIEFDGKYFRRDIGWREVAREHA